MWKVKINAILVNDGCGVASKIKIRNIRFATANILLALDAKMLFNVQTVDTIIKDFWDGFQRVYEDKSLVNKIF